MQIPFSSESRKKFNGYLDQIFSTSQWSHGHFNRSFEESFSQFTQLHSSTAASGGAGLWALFKYANLNGGEVIVPVNTFWATAVAVEHADGAPVFADCNKNDLCLSFDSMVSKVTEKTKAVVVTHIGGHIAFDIEKINQYCRDNNIFLIEDCAHAHGATYKGKAAGSWGLGGSYSFYATKTLPTGEGGMVVSSSQDFIDWYESFKNYGKKIVEGQIQYPVKNGFNLRMNEMTAALGLVQMDELPKIISFKRELAEKYDEIFSEPLKIPDAMESGFYKYILFNQELKLQTGRVYQWSDGAV